jgi:hypothetical protein
MNIGDIVTIRLAAPKRMLWYTDSEGKPFRLVSRDQTAKVKMDMFLRRHLGLGLIEIVGEGGKEPAVEYDGKEVTETPNAPTNDNQTRAVRRDQGPAGKHS